MEPRYTEGLDYAYGKVTRKPNTMQIENQRMIEAVRWAVTACDAIHRAGGMATLLNEFSDDLITTMIRNGINLSK